MDVKVQAIVRRPVEEVFQAIVSSSHLCGYFTSSSSSDLIEGKTIDWEWDDVGAKISIHVDQVVSNNAIHFRWSATGRERHVHIEFNKQSETSTKIFISEKGFGLNEKEVGLMMGQTEGWTDFLCSLKAYLYTGINLRKAN